MASGEVRGRISEQVRTEMRSDGGTDVGRQCERLGNTVCTGLVQRIAQHGN